MCIRDRYKGLEVKKGRVTVAQKDIEAQVENYRHQFAELTTKENDEVAKGATVVMDFEGFIDGEAFEGGKAENHSLEIGSGPVSYTHLDVYKRQQ